MGPSIPEIERQLMFLNEPTLQLAGGSQNFMKHLYKVHQRVISYEFPQASITYEPSLDSIRPSVQSFSDLYPKDYSKFKDSCHQQLIQISDELTSLRAQVKSQNSQITETVGQFEKQQALFQNLYDEMTSFFDHLNSKIAFITERQSVIMDQNKILEATCLKERNNYQSQKLQLLNIIEELTSQLNQSELDWQEVTKAREYNNRQILTEGEINLNKKMIDQLKKEVETLIAENSKLKVVNEQMTQNNEKMKKIQLQKVTEVEFKDFQVFNLMEEKRQLEGELSETKERLQGLEKAKDKIILKLKKELQEYQ